MSGVGTNKDRAGLAGLRREVDEALGDVDPDDLDAAARRGQRVAPRPAAHIEHSLAGRETEHLGEEPHLLLGPLGKGIAEVGLAEMLG